MLRMFLQTTRRYSTYPPPRSTYNWDAIDTGIRFVALIVFSYNFCIHQNDVLKRLFVTDLDLRMNKLKMEQMQNDLEELKKKVEK